MALSLKARCRVALVLALLLPLGAVLLYSFPPTQTGWYPKCVLYVNTGLHCPGCGATRCLHALSHGHLLQAMAYNVMIVAFLPFFVIWLASHTWAVVRGTAPPRRWLSPRGCWVIVALFLGFAVLRNVPHYPFTLLAPHALEQGETETPL